VRFFCIITNYKNQLLFTTLYHLEITRHVRCLRKIENKRSSRSHQNQMIHTLELRLISDSLFL